MHISNTFTNQLKGHGFIEKVQGLLVGLSCLLSKQFDDACVLSLKENRVGLHGLQCDRFYKLEIKVNGIKHLIIGNATLDNIVLLMRQAFTAASHIVKLFAIVSREELAVYIRSLFCKLKNIHASTAWVMNFLIKRKQRIRVSSAEREESRTQFN